VTRSLLSHSARRRGCTLVVNLNPAFSFINTIPAGTDALIGEIILHIPVNSEEEEKQEDANCINLIDENMAAETCNWQ